MRLETHADIYEPKILLPLTDFNHNYSNSAYLITIRQVPNFIKISSAVFLLV